MGYYCTVPQCTSLAGKTKSVKFHRFPRDTTMADKWNVILKRGKPYTKYSKVCSLHFTQSDYNVTTMGQWKTLSKDAVPTQNLPKLNPDGTVMVIRKSRTVKYREGKKDETLCDKTDKWILPLSHTPLPASIADSIHGDHIQDSSIAYRLQTLSAIASTLSPQQPIPQLKPKKQDAIMQTDPVQSEEDDTQPNNSYSEASENSFNSEHLDPYYQKDAGYQKDTVYQKDSVYKDPTVYQKDLPYQRDVPIPSPYQKDVAYQKEGLASPYQKEGLASPYQKEGLASPYQKEGLASPYQKEGLASPYQKEGLASPYQKDAMPYQKDKTYDTDKYESPKDYTKQDDYIPQTNEEFNKEAEKYALGRKSHIAYEKIDATYQKSVSDTGYQKIPELYTGYDKEYQRPDFVYPNGYPDSVEVLRNQQHNLQMLQEPHSRITENQNFYTENHIKQEIEDDKFMYERSKDQLDANAMYPGHGVPRPRPDLLQHQVKQEPETSGCDSVMQPQGSPYYAANSHNVTGGYYEALARPGPELLIAKQNALAAHTQLWTNTMKRPFFYSDNPHYAAPQLLHRYTEDLTRILQ